MDIILAKRLKELRCRKGNTQEELANFLSVSTAAVSKWERKETYPDLTLLPKISAYYNVTVDDLLGVGEIRRRERIEWYDKESRKLRKLGGISEVVALWREAFNEFPNEHYVILQLADNLFYQNSGDRERCKEVIELSERILGESTDQGLRDRAIQLLCLSYDELGDSEKAREYAEMGGDMYCSAELLLSHVLKKEEGENHNKRLICKLVDMIGQCTFQLDSINWESRIEFYLKILETLFDDGFYGFYATRASERHRWCAEIYAGREEEEKVKYHLEQLVRFARQYDSLNGKYTYSCTMLNGLTDNSAQSSTNTGGTDCGRHLEALTGPESRMFDKYREADWFQNVIKALSENQKDPMSVLIEENMDEIGG